MVPVFARRSSSKISSWHLRPGWQERDPGAFFLGCQRWRLKSDIFLGNGVHVLLKEGNGDDETQKSSLKEAFKDFMTFHKLKSTLFSRWRCIYLSGWISFRWFDAFRDFGNPNPNLTCLEVKGWWNIAIYRNLWPFRWTFVCLWSSLRILRSALDRGNCEIIIIHVFFAYSIFRQHKYHLLRKAGMF